MAIFEQRSGGAVLRGESEGTDSGACFVMLHAGVADRRMWRGALAALAARGRAIAYDRRGFGESTTPDEPFRHLDDLAAVLDRFSVERATLIGCSQGGRVAIDYALAHPARVASLVLVATAVSGAPPPKEYPPAIAMLMTGLDAAEEAGDLDRVNAIEAHLWLDGPLSEEGRVGGAARALFLDMNLRALSHPELTREEFSPAAIGRLGEIAAPTLVVWGDLDFPHIQQRSAQIAATIPGAGGLVMPASAHLPSLEQPQAFNAIIDAFPS